VSFYTQIVINGLLIGALWALLGAGKNFILGTMGFINFAHANFALVGMYITYFAWYSLRINPYFLFPLAAVVLAILGFALNRPFTRPLVHAGQRAQILATWGMSTLLQYGANSLFGSRDYIISNAWANSGFHLGSTIFITKAAIVGAIISIIVVLATWYLVAYTPFGLRVRGISQNRDAAVYLGIDVDRLYSRAFSLSLVLAGIVGSLYAIVTPVDPQTAVPLFLLMFVVSVLGGFGSLLGCFIGGAIVGVLQGLTTVELSPQLENAAIYVVFLAFLILRPQGILGTKAAIRGGPF
jgi:branched-chain amino acid transport system permease protein